MGDMTAAAESTLPTRDPDRPNRLLRAEHDTLLPLLRGTASPDFNRTTACPDWSVRDVLAHCSAVLNRVITGQLNDFTPELNEVDVAERRSWPLPRLLDELASGCQAAGPVMGAGSPRLDIIALGVWVHGGDVRDALGEPQPYGRAGFGDAAVLLAGFAWYRKIPRTEVLLPDTSLDLGVSQPGRPAARLRTGPDTLIRLIAGRPASAADYELTGAGAAELVVF
jgi:uncharacterized protein (TIGR03083 family)